MSTKAAQFVADKLNTLLDAPAEQQLRELVGDLKCLHGTLYRVVKSGIICGDSGDCDHDSLATCIQSRIDEELDALVKKYGERG